VSTRNTNIAKSRLGAPRFPFESPAVGEGYTWPGGVNTYTLTPEEIAARYGPPVARSHQHDSYGAARIKEVISTCETPEEAALELKLNVLRIKQLATRLNIDAPWKRQTKEPEEGEINLDVLDAIKAKQNDSVRGMADDFEKLIPKEKYLKLKALGHSDSKILKDAGLPFPNGKHHLTRAKMAWGVAGMSIKDQKEAKGMVFETYKEDGKVVEATEATEPKEEYTINQLLDLHDDLENEVENLDMLLDPESTVTIVTSIRVILSERRCGSAMKLQRIHELFDSVKVAL